MKFNPIDRGIVGDRRLLLHDGFRLPDHVRRPLDRRAARQLGDNEKGALVILGQESRRRDFAPARRRRTPRRATTTSPMTENRTMRATAAP